MKEILIFDGVMPDPVAYRADALKHEFRTYTFGPDEVFHGIALAGQNFSLPSWIIAKFPTLTPRVNFFRKSPLEQVEPTFIHSDDGMGDWTAILYLNEKVTEGDGTVFWKHKESGEIQAQTSKTDRFSEDFKDLSKWELWNRAKAAFNRVVMFPAPFFHSRAIFSNYGQDDDARLIQVVFGTGSID